MRSVAAVLATILSGVLVQSLAYAESTEPSPQARVWLFDGNAEHYLAIAPLADPKEPILAFDPDDDRT